MIEVYLHIKQMCMPSIVLLFSFKPKKGLYQAFVILCFEWRSALAWYWIQYSQRDVNEFYGMQQTWKTLKKEKAHFPFSCILAEHWPGYESSKCQEEGIIKKAL